MYRILTLAALSIFLCNQASAELVISSAGVATTITFDSTLTGSNNGQFAGSGLGNAPAVGQLDSTSWTILGMSSAADLSRGTSTGSVTTGGLYAFDRGSSNNLLGVQPGGSDFTPGSITLKLTNNTGDAVSDFDIGYDIWAFNDKDRANSLNFSYSTDGSSFTSVGGFDFTTVEVADGSPSWQSANRAGNVVLEIANGTDLFLRWTGDDVSGGGSRDEYGVDDISITFNTSPVPEPTSLLMFGTAIAGLGFRRRRK